MSRICPCDDPLCKYNVLPSADLQTGNEALWVLVDTEAVSSNNYKVLLAKKPDGTLALCTRNTVVLSPDEILALGSALLDRKDAGDAEKLKLAREALQHIATARHGYPADAPPDSAVLAERTLAKIA